MSKINYNGKRYDTEKCTSLGEHDHYNNGTYSGPTELLVASDGTYISRTISNGQDCYLQSSFRVLATAEAREALDSMDQNDDQERAAVAAGLITMVE